MGRANFESEQFSKKMNRDQQLSKLETTDEWDIAIIGGGASGLGIAVDAAHRGYKTILIEKNDFAKGTSSRSTKLVHGGVRYLQNGDIFRTGHKIKSLDTCLL